MRVESGDIFLSRVSLSWRPGSWVSYLIRKITKTDWSHCGIFVRIWDQPYIIEALPGGIRLISPKDYPWKEAAIGRLPGRIDEKKFCLRALSKVGTTEYDMKSVLVDQTIYSITGKWFGHTANSEKTGRRMYCSEFVAWMHSDMFINWWSETPGSISKHPSISFQSIDLDSLA